MNEIFSHERGSLIRTAIRIERLATDRVEIADGGAPRPTDFAEAPSLDEYRLAEKQVTCLVGVQSGSPSLAGPLIETSEDYAMPAHGEWARTLSRYYRLGRARSAPLNG